MKTNKEVKARLKELYKEHGEITKRFKRYGGDESAARLDILDRAILELQWVLTNEKPEKEE